MFANKNENFLLLYRFHRSFISSLMYLSHAGIYPLDILQRVMHPDYLRNMYNNNSFKVGHPYLILESGLQIEVPEYKGPTLPPKIRNYLVKVINFLQYVDLFYINVIQFIVFITEI